MNKRSVDANDLMFELQEQLQKDTGSYIALCYYSASLDGEYTAQDLRKIADALDILEEKRKEEELENTKERKLSIDENTYVYCTLCKHGEELFNNLMNKEFKEPKHCIGCCSLNPEDSMSLKDRPNYVSLNEK